MDDMDKYKNKKAELRAWAKDDIVPTDLQWLCKAIAEIIEHLQAELEKEQEKCAEQGMRLMDFKEYQDLKGGK